LGASMPLSTAQHLEFPIDEYKTLISDLDDPEDDSKLQNLLITESEWSVQGSAARLHLARYYGSFVLSNALALAEALEIEDGDCGI
jgi:hypothetical protein